MDERGIKDFQDIVRFTPGVNIDNSGTNAISIRGISSSAGAGTTGIYIDDTPIQMRALGFNPDDTLPKTFDLERVEVLRGPQGTLFGAGSEGGAVRYIMTQPSLDAPSPHLRAQRGLLHGVRAAERRVRHRPRRPDRRRRVRLSRAASGTATTAAGSIAWTTAPAPSSTTTSITRNYAGGPPRGHVAADDSLTVTPEHAVSEQQAARRLDLLAGVFESRRRAFQHRHAGAHPAARTVLPARAQGAVGPRQLADHLQHLVLPAATSSPPTRARTTTWPTTRGWQTILRTRPAAPHAPARLPWYPLLDGNGIHLPAGIGGHADAEHR